MANSEQDRNYGRKRFARNAGAQYALQAAKYLFPFITVAYLTRTLGPDVYAVRAFVMAVMTFMLIFLDFGFMNYGTKAIAEARDAAERSAITSAITALRAGLCLVGAIILVPITLSLPIMAAWPAYVALAYIGTCFKAFLPDFVFQGLEDMAILTYRFVVSQIVAVGLIVLFVHGPQDLLLVAAFEALGNLIALVWSWANVFRRRGITPQRPNTTLLRPAFNQSSIFFISSVATTALTSFTTLFIGIFIDNPAQISYWAVAMTALGAVQALYVPLQNSIYPHMVKRRDYALLRKVVIVGTIAATAAAFAFAQLDWLIMLLLGGEQFLDGAYVISLIAPVIAFSYPLMMLGVPGLAAVGKTKQLAMTSIIGAIFQIAGLFVLEFSGNFTIEAVCILRCAAEALICLLRVSLFLRFRSRERAGLEPSVNQGV